MLLRAFGHRLAIAMQLPCPAIERCCHACPLTHARACRISILPEGYTAPAILVVGIAMPTKHRHDRVLSGVSA
jgi:hypothetical protein